MVLEKDIVSLTIGAGCSKLKKMAASFHDECAIELLNPNALPCAAFRRGPRVIGVELLLNDVDDLLDGQIGLRIAAADAGDADVANGAVEVGGEDFGPFGGIGAGCSLVGH